MNFLKIAHTRNICLVMRISVQSAIYILNKMQQNLVSHNTALQRQKTVSAHL